MTVHMKICVLIPSYNEERTIGAIVAVLRGMGLPVYVVDDGSNDNTATEAGKAGAEVIRHEKNTGKGASLIDGFGRALKDGFDAVLVMDGDGQHSTGDVLSFINTMGEGGFDIVIGNRMQDTGSMPFVRIHTNRFMSSLLSKVAGQPIPDSQCGFRLIKRNVLEKIRLNSSKFETESELLIKAGRAGFRIGSVPVRTVYQGEKSRINPVIDTLRFFRLLIWTAFER